MKKGYFTAYKENASCKLLFGSLFCGANETAMHSDGMKMYLNYNIKWDARFVKDPCYETDNKRSDGAQLFLMKLRKL